MSSVYSRVDKKQVALSMAVRANQIFREISGENSYDAGASYSTIAGAYSRLGNTKKALEYSKLCVDILEGLGTDYTARIAIEYNNQGVYLMRDKNYRDALKVMLKAKDILSSMQSDQRPKIARTHLRLAEIRYFLGKPKKALLHLRMADQILSQFDPDELKVERELRKTLIANTGLE